MNSSTFFGFKYGGTSLLLTTARTVSEVTGAHPGSGYCRYPLLAAEEQFSQRVIDEWPPRPINCADIPKVRSAPKHMAAFRPAHPYKLAWQRKTSTSGAKVRSAPKPCPFARALVQPGRWIRANAPPITPSRPLANTVGQSGCGSPVRYWAAPGAGIERLTGRYRALALSIAGTAYTLNVSNTRTLAIAPKANRKPSSDCGIRIGDIANAFYQDHSKPSTTNQAQGPETRR